MKLIMMDWLLQNSVEGFSGAPFSLSLPPLPHPIVCRRVSSPVPLEGSSSLARVPPSLHSLSGLSFPSSQGPQGCHLPSPLRSHHHHLFLGVFLSPISFSEWDVAFCLSLFSYPSNKCTKSFQNFAVNHMGQ